MRPKILITRPIALAEDLAKDIAAHDIPVDCIIAPLLTIQYHDFTPPAADALVFTSVHGVEAFIRNSDTRTHDVISVGPQTAAAARDAGFEHVYACKGTAKDIESYCENKYAGKTVLHVHGASYTPLAMKNVDVLECTGYTAEAVLALPDVALEAIQSGALDAIVFFSSRTAALFKTQIEEADCTSYLSTIKALTLSEEVLEYVRVLPMYKTYTAKQPNRGGMINLLKDLYAS